ncbi:unnamed protein product [Sphagnum troendelagicum]|uniref:Carbohydrate binding module family 25 domain-containing protein n=1 Tax=Sphagnum troendelagicum TaxID=128251 RepID=A0ABP0TMS5_9BRYO
MAAAATAAAAPSLIAGHGQRLVTERKTTHNGLKEWSLETARKKKTSPRRMLQQCRAQHGFFSSSSSRGGAKKSSSSSSSSSSRPPAMREEDAATLQEMTKLSDELFLLKGVLKQEGGDRGIGLDMRNRVDILYTRATMLKQSADRSVAAGGGRIPVQLTATLRALQRELGSVENIVRLAMEAGPVTTFSAPKLNSRLQKQQEEDDDDNDDDNDLQNQLQEEEVQNRRPKALNLLLPQENEDTPRVALKEQEQKGMRFEALIRESSVVEEEPAANVPPNPPTYTMSSPAAKDSSPLAAFKTEIERRVMEQLVGKRMMELQSTPLIDTGVGIGREASTAPATNDNTSTKAHILQEENLFLSMTDTQRRPLGMRTKRSDATSMEVDKLRAYLTAMQQEVSTLREKATRAELAEAKVRVEMATTTVPSEVHEQAVRVARKEITEAQAQTAEVTSKLKEKEAMLMAVQKELMAEGESLVAKVRELSGELTKRVSAEDMEAAIKRAVKEVKLELENALENGLALSHELEEKERQIVQLQEEWHLERSNLCAELASVRKSLATVEQERVSEKEQLQETQQKVHVLEKKLSEVYQSMNDAEEERLKKQQAVLSTVRSLVLDMGRNEGISLGANSQDGCEYSVSTIFSEEKVAALEKFFAILRVLIKQESQKMDTFAFALQQVLLNDRFSGETMTRDSKIKGANEEAMKPTITLCYETSWESAYLHYCADSTQWTDLPGILMQNQSAADGRPFKVLHVSGSSVEFVLTDGNGSWDCPPAGGNYYIQNSGTFLLASGVIQQQG